MTKLFIAWVKKKLGIQKPSGILLGYEYEYDYLKALKAFKAKIKSEVGDSYK